MAKRFLSNINVNDQYTLPAADGLTGQVIQTDGAGNLSFVDFASDEARKIVFTVKNKDSISLSKGTVVHASPSANPPSGNIVEVIRADNNDSTKMPAIGVLNETLAVDAEGECVVIGSVTNIATNSFTAGDTLYVSDTPGEFTNTKPTGINNLIQKIGIVVKSHATNGSVEVFGTFRSNDVPNALDRDLTLTGNADLFFEDGRQIRMGNTIGSPGLRIQSVGSNSYIDGEIGNLYVRTETDDSDLIFQADNGAGGNATYFQLDGSAATHDGVNTTALYTWWGDNSRIALGASKDLQIYHDSTHSYIYDAGTGRLNLRTNQFRVVNAANSEIIIDATENGAVKLYYDNSLKFETLIAGVKVTGDTTTTGHYFADTHFRSTDSNVTLSATGSGGVYLRPDGFDQTSSQVVIAASTGDATFSGNISLPDNIFVGQSNSTDNYVKIFHSDNTYTEIHGYGIISDRTSYYLRPVNDGTQTLYLGNADATKDWNSVQVKFATDVDFVQNGTRRFTVETGGINVVGNANISGSYLINDTSIISTSSTYTQLRNPEGTICIYLGDSANRTNYYDNNVHTFRNFGSSTTYAVLNSTGLGIGTTSPDEKLVVYGSVNNDDIAIKIKNTYDDNTVGSAPASALILESASNNGYIRLTGSPADVASEHILDIGSTATGNEITFTTQSTERVRIDASGNVGIGTSSPSYKLEVNGIAKIHNGIITDVGVPLKMIVNNGALNDSTELRTGSGEFKLYSGRYNSTHQAFVFATGDNYTSGSERMRITSGGRVGIGTTNPTTYFQVNSGTENSVAIFESTDANAHIRVVDINATVRIENNSGKLILGADLDSQQADSYISFEIDGASEKMRIDSSGNVGIGSTSPATHINTGSYFKPDSAGLFLTLKDDSGSFLMLESGTTTDNDQVGGIYFNNTAGQSDAHKQIAGIDAILDKHVTSDALNGADLRFFTKPPGSGTNDERMIIKSGGNVGIGLNNPSAPLHVDGGSNAEVLKIEADVSPYIRWVENGTNIGFLQFTGSTAYLSNMANGSFQFRTNNLTRMFITSGGDVGIGTTSPSQKAVISGPNTAPSLNTTAVSSASLLVSNSDTGYGTYFATTAAGIGLIQQRRQTSAVYYDLSLQPYGGDVGIGTLSPTCLFHVQGNPASTGVLGRFYGSGTLGSLIQFDRGSSYNWKAGIGGASSSTPIPSSYFGIAETTQGARLVIAHTTGNVGIGTTSPSQKLHVAGNLRVTGAYYDSNNSSGTADQVLVSTGTGTDWQDLSDISGVDGTGASGQVAVWSDTDTITGYTRFKVYDAGGQIQVTDGTRDIRINSGYGGSTAMIGTVGSHDLGFMTANNQRVTIDSSGSVGIGTTSPSAKLDVVAATGIGLEARTGDGSFAGYFLTPYDYVAKFESSDAGAAIILEDSNSSANANRIGVITNDITITTAGSERMRIDSSGNVNLTTGRLRIARGSDEGSQLNLWADSNGFCFIAGYDLEIKTGNNNARSTRVKIKHTGEVGIGTASPTEALDVNGNIKHTGLTMTSGTDVDQVSTFDMTFQLTADTWTDTGIDGTDLGTGTYAIQVYVDDNGASGNHYAEYYSGMMSWYADSTNSTVVDEIPLHRAGHAPNDGNIMLRTQRASGTDTHDLMLQIKHDRTHTLAMNGTDNRTIRFKFRRLI